MVGSSYRIATPRKGVARAAGPALATRVAELRAAILQHKRAIRIHREQLAAKAAELQQLEAACAEAGQALVIRKA